MYHTHTENLRGASFEKRERWSLDLNIHNMVFWSRLWIGVFAQPHERTQDPTMVISQRFSAHDWNESSDRPRIWMPFLSLLIKYDQSVRDPEYSVYVIDHDTFHNWRTRSIWIRSLCSIMTCSIPPRPTSLKKAAPTTQRSKAWAPLWKRWRAFGMTRLL